MVKDLHQRCGMWGGCAAVSLLFVSLNGCSWLRADEEEPEQEVAGEPVTDPASNVAAVQAAAEPQAAATPEVVAAASETESMPASPADEPATSENTVAQPADEVSAASGEVVADTVPAAPPVLEVPPPEMRPTQTTMEACDDASFPDHTMLERVRRRLTITACASSAWLDSLFGNQLHYDEYRSTYGSVSAGSLWSDYDGFDPRLRFRARLQLPQWNRRVSAFAGRVGEEEYISDTEGDFDALPTRQFGGVEDESVLLGLGYASPSRTGNDFDAGIGVRVDVPLDPYAQTRYEIVRTFAEDYVFRARETVFWRNSEGLGSTTRFNVDRALSERFLLRFNNVGKYTQETDGLEWVSEISLFQSVGARTGLAWQLYMNGLTDNEVPITRYGARLIMRRQLNIDWLFVEVRGGVGWPRRWLYEERDPSPEAGIALEMQFGKRSSHRDQ